ncbi:MAG: superoxide dismutase, Ni [Robiginitomaculum sp.]|nr:MAG: superoxide dismutase, Ni [Robiginitomaculum sp.]
MLHTLISKLDTSLETASAHCDIPCGIYDPQPALYHALSVVRQMDILLGLKDKELDVHTCMQIARNTAEKEKQAEKVKVEIRIIWGDFIKGDNLKNNPQAHDLAHGIMLKASACKQDLHREDGEALVELVNEFAEMFWKIKGVKTKRVTAPYAPALEVVYPDL